MERRGRYGSPAVQLREWVRGCWPPPSASSVLDSRGTRVRLDLSVGPTCFAVWRSSRGALSHCAQVFPEPRNVFRDYYDVDPNEVFHRERRAAAAGRAPLRGSAGSRAWRGAGAMTYSELRREPPINRGGAHVCRDLSRDIRSAGESPGWPRHHPDVWRPMSWDVTPADRAGRDRCAQFEGLAVMPMTPTPSCMTVASCWAALLRLRGVWGISRSMPGSCSRIASTQRRVLQLDRGSSQAPNTRLREDVRASCRPAKSWRRCVAEALASRGRHPLRPIIHRRSHGRQLHSRNAAATLLLRAS